MAHFIVTTWEHVTGTYVVEADDEAAARAKFERPRHLIEWEDVDQTNYAAFDLEVRSVVADE